MISSKATAPDFTLSDQFGREIRLSQFKGKQHVMLFFYPLDFTPTWSVEVPALEALLGEFRKANTQPLGVSVDSAYSHANWGKSLEGISFPLLADFHPKGAMAKSYGLYLEDSGITDRATVIIDANGVVQHASSVTPAGKRDIGALLKLCQGVDKEFSGKLAGSPEMRSVESDAVLYVKSRCGFSRAVLLVRDNLHLDKIPVKNITENPSAKDELEKLAGKDQAPCLIVGGKAIQDSKEITKHLVRRITGF